MASDAPGSSSTGAILPHFNYEDAMRAVVELVESEDNPTGKNLIEFGIKEGPVTGLDLVEMAREIQKADNLVASTTCGKLETILEQMRFLQQQAKKVLEDAARDSDLHHVACNVVKRVGQVYYLYRRPSGQRYFSLLSMQEWGSSCPHEYLGAYILKGDMTFAPADEHGQDLRTQAQKEDASMLRHLVHATTRPEARGHADCPIEAVIVRPRALTPPNGN